MASSGEGTSLSPAPFTMSLPRNASFRSIWRRLFPRCALSNGGCTMTGPTDADNDPAARSRRRFLREGSALMGGAVLAGGLAGRALAAGENADNLPPNIPEWMKTPGDPMGSQLYGTPSPFENSVVKNIPKNLPQYLSASGRTPLQDLDGIITPNGLFYERHHGGVPPNRPAPHRTTAPCLLQKAQGFTIDYLTRLPSPAPPSLPERPLHTPPQKPLRQA